MNTPYVPVKTVKILVQDLNDDWIHVKNIEYYNDQHVFNEMLQVRAAWQNKRVKATDDYGRLVDIIG
jgi:hypothetical protein